MELAQATSGKNSFGSKEEGLGWKYFVLSQKIILRTGVGLLI